MTKKIFLILVLVFILAGIIAGRQIMFNEAQVVAENWTITMNRKFDDNVRVTDGREIFRDKILVAYVFDLYPKGYVIISAQDYLPPVKMFSFSTDFKTSGTPVENIILANFSAVISFVKEKELEGKKDFGKKNNDRFKRFLSKDTDKSVNIKAAFVNEVKPLLFTTWGQGDPFNRFTPVVRGFKTPAGCVATAIAQVMHYYRWPKKGNGEYSYFNKYNGLTLWTSFEKEYVWDLMTYNYIGKTGNLESDIAVAELLFDVGVAMEMNYQPYGSGARTEPNERLIKNLKYSPDMKRIYRASDSPPKVWMDKVKLQIDNCWPVIFSIASADLNLDGHAVVIDGYRIYDGMESFHINFGWGGGGDGYFSLNNIDVLHFAELDPDWQGMIINFYPHPEYNKKYTVTIKEVLQ